MPAFLGRMGALLLSLFVGPPPAAANAVFQDVLKVPRVGGNL
jgi:hypothetical protein